MAEPAEPAPTTEGFSRVEVADDRVWVRPSGVASFAGDLPEDEQQVVRSTHFAPAVDLFDQKAEGVARRSKPSGYVVANNDRTVQPKPERSMASRMGARTYEVGSGHVPMLSRPDFVLDVIRAAAEHVQQSTEAWTDRGS